jgi:hypothetical protein
MNAIGSCKTKKRILIVCVAPDEIRRRLVYVKSRALVVIPAGPIGFGSPFCCEDKAESPPAAAIAKAFRAQARPQPSQGSPPCPTGVARNARLESAPADCRETADLAIFNFFTQVGQATVEGALERETP